MSQEAYQKSFRFVTYLVVVEDFICDLRKIFRQVPSPIYGFVHLPLPSKGSEN